ncbi:hypothetical protein ACROYT_G004783 [Oculina patagonica]
MCKDERSPFLSVFVRISVNPKESTDVVSLAGSKSRVFSPKISRSREDAMFVLICRHFKLALSYPFFARSRNPMEPP